eukprot:7391682-Prymnesium_polylepis.4
MQQRCPSAAYPPHCGRAQRATHITTNAAYAPQCTRRGSPDNLRARDADALGVLAQTESGIAPRYAAPSDAGCRVSAADSAWWHHAWCRACLPSKAGRRRVVRDGVPYD